VWSGRAYTHARLLLPEGSNYDARTRRQLANLIWTRTILYGKILPIVPMHNGADRLTGSRLEPHALRVSHWNQRCLHDRLERNTE